MPFSFNPWGGVTRRLRVVRIGAGLHLFVDGGDGDIVDLKIAQPRDLQIGENVAEIREAAYVQWRRKKLPKTDGRPAITITAVSNETAPR